MANKQFSEQLKALRKKAGFSQKQVYEHFGIPQSTFASWENGISEPSGEMLIKLCRYYIVDIATSFPIDDTLTQSEWNFIGMYRRLDAYGRKFAEMIMARELERISKEGEINEREHNQKES